MNEDDFAIVLGGVIGIVVVIIFFVYVPSQLNNIHSASATTDYFSWSCQQLKEQVNQDLNTSNHLLMNSDSTREGTEAIALLNIMQLKGCSA